MRVFFLHCILANNRCNQALKFLLIWEVKISGSRPVMILPQPDRSQLQICVAKCPLDMSTWISSRHHELNMSKTELLPSPHRSRSQHTPLPVFSILADETSIHSEKSKSLPQPSNGQFITKPCQSSLQMKFWLFFSSPLLPLYWSYLQHLSSEFFFLKIFCIFNSFWEFLWYPRMIILKLNLIVSLTSK